MNTSRILANRDNDLANIVAITGEPRDVVIAVLAANDGRRTHQNLPRQRANRRRVGFDGYRGWLEGDGE